MAITKNTSSYRVHGWEHGQDSYESPEAASKDYKDWSGGFTPEEDGLKVISNKNHKRLNGMQKEDLDEVMKTPAEWKAEREKAHPGWNDHDTEDFQKRGGNYPKSNVPDSIEHQNHGMVFTFKNTDEKTAAAFAKAHMAKHKLKHGKITTRQDGDYHNDWVQAHVHHPEVKESEDLDESGPQARGHWIGSLNNPDKHGIDDGSELKPKEKTKLSPTWYHPNSPEGKALVAKKKNESLELIDSISEGDTIKSTEKFSSALMSRVFSLIEERRQEVAQNMFIESNKSVLPGHPYHNKTQAELQYIMKDAAKAAKNMQGHDSKSEAKYLDQVNDASTILYARQKHGSAMESIELDEIKSNKNSYGVVDIDNSKYTHTDLTKEKAQRKAQEMNVAHYGHQKPTGAGTELPKKYAKVLHLPGRKVGEKYAGDLSILSGSM